MAVPQHEVDGTLRLRAAAGRVAGPQWQAGLVAARAPRLPAGEAAGLARQVGEGGLQRCDPDAEPANVDKGVGVRRRGGDRERGRDGRRRRAPERADARHAAGRRDDEQPSEALRAIEKGEGGSPVAAGYGESGAGVLRQVQDEVTRRPQRQGEPARGDDDEPAHCRLRRTQQRQRGGTDPARDRPLSLPPADEGEDGGDDGEQRRAVPVDGWRPIHGTRRYRDGGLMSRNIFLNTFFPCGRIGTAPLR
jgi:hypothetical protein